MKHLYPSMTELLAFTSSAKHLSFSRAARELDLTPSAVSRQIANLESYLRAQLFIRDGRSLALTRSGRLYLARVADPVHDIGNASLELLAARAENDLLTIASVPTFTTKWLIPRLPAFLADTPGVTISFCRHLAQGDPFPLDLDAAIRYGDGKWEGVVSDYIDGHTFVLVCAPDFPHTHALRQPKDAARASRLLHGQAEVAWQQWAKRYAVQDMHALAGPRFEQYSVLIQAAQAGLGLALIPDFLVRDNLAAGTLIEPFSAPVDVEQGHYLCYFPERLETQPHLKRFRAWLLTQASKR
ncbi:MULTISPECIES: LysR substrate-binding domain-containing protein [Ralstonia solanacearum species complex]|uniref:LysR family transcriptional regulator n=2 Tax=Ralstonia solanacearum species complex TaxID=3116862 RepID=A0AAD0WFT7_RALSL|nr:MULTISPECIES: LysR substrate-binding domain-containing protein [Ralstonia solanacearum species complex]BEU71857.1 LysR substrate-binding domain-containing protein [Ralstonia pseudosolanacearum]AMP37376.1 LysR family transcriptional regulator [Ralstonia solanacearum]AXV76786.1 LysR family transcriptional regulator [Ralstonia solanacearum]AXV81365.1 LysR family transcriptional regulator [Ralstonia solanacearum]AXV86197.1 LysR family transcriptional regulator [Ralstonia solanacearum]